MKPPLMLALALAALCTGCVASPRSRFYVPPSPPKGYAYMPKEGWGKISGQPHTQWLPDGRRLSLDQDISYTEATGRLWDAPKDSVIDGASIPRPLWAIVGGPLEGQYRVASIFHDVACDNRTARWQDVHLMFYRAMRCSGVPQKQAQTLFTAVWYFGPHWDAPNPVLALLGAKATPKVSLVATKADIRAIQATVNSSTKPSLEPKKVEEKIPTVRAEQLKQAAAPAPAAN